MDNNTIKGLLKDIEGSLGWGDSDTWTSRDFEKLNLLIQEKTKVSLSASTLRRLWGKAEYYNKPSQTTLDTLAQFVGFKSWRDYLFNHSERIIPTRQPANRVMSKKSWLILLSVLSGLFVVLWTINLITSNHKRAHIVRYAFGSHAIVRNLPNTVVFTYDAQSALNTDSVFIQQSWDSTKRVLVSKNKHLFNSIYYKPGYYHAKLTVGDQVVKEHPLLIPTNGWLCLIDQPTIPVYLEKKEFITDNQINVDQSIIVNHHVSIEPQPATIEVYNMGNFEPTPICDFSYRAEVKNDYKLGASQCQQINVVLYTTDIPISIPLSAPGCVASLHLLDGHRGFKGTDTDLTGFGFDPSHWIKLAFTSQKDEIQIIINGRRIYNIKINDCSAKILGLGFQFQGSAQIRNVDLSSGTHEILQAFN